MECLIHWTRIHNLTSMFDILPIQYISIYLVSYKFITMTNHRFFPGHVLDCVCESRSFTNSHEKRQCCWSYGFSQLNRNAEMFRAHCYANESWLGNGWKFGLAKNCWVESIVWWPSWQSVVCSLQPAGREGTRLVQWTYDSACPPPRLVAT